MVSAYEEHRDKSAHSKDSLSNEESCLVWEHLVERYKCIINIGGMNIEMGQELVTLTGSNSCEVVCQ